MRPPEDWWRLLNSPELNEVVALALGNSLSLNIARANLARAQEGLAAARGQRSVQLDLASQVARNKYGSAFLGPEADTFPTFLDYSVGPTVSYDLDIFGGLRHRVERAGAMATYERQQLRAARPAGARRHLDRSTRHRIGASPDPRHRADRGRRREDARSGARRSPGGSRFGHRCPDRREPAGSGPDVIATAVPAIGCGAGRTRHSRWAAAPKVDCPQLCTR